MQSTWRHIFRAMRYREGNAKRSDAARRRGDSDDLILQSFVQEYGPTVLSEPPPKKGFNWLAWIVPIAAPLLALLLALGSGAALAAARGALRRRAARLFRPNCSIARSRESTVDGDPMSSVDIGVACILLAARDS